MMSIENGINKTLFWIVAGVAALALAASGVLIATRPNGSPRVLGRKLLTPSPTPAAAQSTVPFVVRTFAPVPIPSEAPPVPVPPASPASTSPNTSTGSSTPTLVCRNSTKPACGRFYWSPAPGTNKALEIKVEWSPASPNPGETVTYWLTVTDPDAQITAYSVGYGDPSRATIAPCSVPARYGPWTPPARRAGKLSLVLHHAYSSTGRFVAEFWARSGDCGSPYGADTTLRVPITVEQASQETEPSPSPSGSLPSSG